MITMKKREIIFNEMNHQLDVHQGHSTQPYKLLFQVSTTMSLLSQGYESKRMVPECYSSSQTNQHSSSHRLSQHSQQSTYLALFYPACTTQNNGPPPFSSTQSLRKSFSFHDSSAAGPESPC